MDKLLPGRSLVLTTGNGYTVTAERSGDGRTLRFVRSHHNGFVVIKTCAF